MTLGASCTWPRADAVFGATTPRQSGLRGCSIDRSHDKSRQHHQHRTQCYEGKTTGVQQPRATHRARSLQDRASHGADAGWREGPRFDGQLGDAPDVQAHQHARRRCEHCDTPEHPGKVHVVTLGATGEHGLKHGSSVDPPRAARTANRVRRGTFDGGGIWSRDDRRTSQRVTSRRRRW